MSKIQGGTIKERLTRLEVLLCNHLQHHEKVEKQHESNQKWIRGIGIIIIAGIAVQILPGLIKSVAAMF